MRVKATLAVLWVSVVSSAAYAGPGTTLPEPGILELLALGAVVGVAVAIRKRRK